jgi:hypothetical protein
VCINVVVCSTHADARAAAAYWKNGSIFSEGLLLIVIVVPSPSHVLSTRPVGPIDSIIQSECLLLLLLRFYLFYFS